MKDKSTKKRGPGKMTKDIKEVLLIAFEKAGGCSYLVKQSKENPKAFMALLGRCIPAQVSLDISVSLDLGKALEDAEKNRARLNALHTIDHIPEQVPGAKSLITND
jgi:hypothetical protein